MDGYKSAIPELETLALEMPLAGGGHKVYQIRECSALTMKLLQSGVRVERAMAANETPNPDDVPFASDEVLSDMLVGPDIIKQMLEDGVPTRFFKLAVKAATAWHWSGNDEEAALAAWSGKGSTDSQRTPKEPDGDAAPTTPSGVGSTTNTRRKSSPRKPKPTTASTGQRSGSSTGSSSLTSDPSTAST